ncbi:DNA phosphorothioation-associated putative methyltransferase [Paraburkholderia tropica]|uniref:DNA phosphorothioation-associated putative methyltransferase n=1 Tax=Paraburkholderia tropica TaxID=92647 RepID=A0ABX5MC27_9BURK|nr:DNA phosphorothioation-associated putative methyltransferase [Paraburkholderia tropica]PXX05456.1 DNA phosphorothioation-associated putative methyltransferase [Paraburkholderia tropica]PZW70719.1 DNA phosphorothioation-associated putative methyltransferase [Paraburkholderia tropica]
MSSTTTREIPAPHLDTDIGKVVARAVYFHVSLLEGLPETVRRNVEKGIALTRLTAGSDFNVIRLGRSLSDMSLLDYPSFFGEAFPALHRSWFIDLDQQTYRYRSYESSINPPILHRKELLIAADHPQRSVFAQLTLTAEQIGLFDDPTRIGFQRTFGALIKQRGYCLVDHTLVPTANEESNDAEGASRPGPIERHRTALSRYGFSAPIQMLSRFGFLDATRSLFDYGCGRGDDVRGLKGLGIEAAGWDPHYANDQPLSRASIVNLGFVINVIENVDERELALKKSYSLSDDILVVSAMLANQDSARGIPYGDGVLTSRNTFQKYYSQSELKEYIDRVTENDAVAVGPGVFFVFKDKDQEQRFRFSRVKSSRRIMPPFRPTRIMAHEHADRSTVTKSRPDRSALLYERHRNALDELWRLCLALGRDPVRPEMQGLQQELRAFRSSAAALRFLKETKVDAANMLERAAASRADDLRVYFALLQFDKRPPYSKLEQQLQVDVKVFFGGYSAALSAGRELLFSLADTQQISDACLQAAEQGIGWLESGESLQLHTDLVERLPPILRAYVGCGTLLYGDVTNADLLKIHVRSGKLTMMKLDDFYGSPLPRMIQRVKINLRKQELTIFDYGEPYSPPYLYRKSRFLNEESPSYSEQVLFEEALEELDVFDLSGYGPDVAAFDAKLEAMRLAVDGYKLIRSTSIPPLDQKCGRYLTFRNLIECGETQAAHDIANMPVEPESFNALLDLAHHVIDPVIDYFGMVKLTFGFCSPKLASHIKGRISPKLDQHAAHERARRGGYICERLGAACDFVVEDEDMAMVVEWIINNVKFDRLYFYGPHRPIHISYSSTPARQVVDMVETAGGNVVPKRRRID